MPKENIQYCVYCGTKNNLKDKKCIKCHKKLNPKDRPLLDYLKTQISEELTGKVEDNIFSITTNYIKSHLYGIILTFSIIASTVCVVTNVINTPRVQEVDEKPAVVQIGYKGTGLSPLAVAEMYVKAADEGDIKTVKSLQLESFYPNIIKDLEEFSLNNPNVYPQPALEHDFIDNREILLKNNISTPYVTEDFLVVSPEGYFGQYHYIGFFMSISYCSYNTCIEENTEIEHDYYSIREEIYLIEVDGNYYVLGEKQAPAMAVEEAVKRRVLFMANGDTTNLSFNKAMEDFDSCNQNDECLEALGYTDLY